MNLRHLIYCGVAIVFLLIATADTAQAQRTTSPDLRGEQRERQQREASLRTAENVATLEKRAQQRIDAAIKQVKEDFKRIQILRNQMVRNLLANNPFDYKLISSETGEISERADRLKKFLIPPVPVDKSVEKNQQGTELKIEEMQEALVQLCNLIAVFIDNPILKNPGEKMDIEQSTRAGTDLQTIIELSSSIKKSADKLISGSK
jgi:hypothetical protein